MIRISQLKLSVSHTQEELRLEIIKTLKIHEDELIAWHIVKRSIDARKKPEIKYIYTIDVQTENQARILRRIRSVNIQKTEPAKYCPPKSGDQPLCHRPVIIGTGPAGLFCGLLLARAGYRPLLFERGGQVEQRQQKVSLMKPQTSSLVREAQEPFLMAN